MRLSEAILLGSLVVKPARGILLQPCFDDTERGCALGMAAKAENLAILDDNGLDPIYDHWPWTFWEGPTCPVNSCFCLRNNMAFKTVALFIAHIFDCHIRADNPLSLPTLYPEWTFEQLVDWVRSVEPAEPEGADVCGLTESSRVIAQPVSTIFSGKDSQK